LHGGAIISAARRVVALATITLPMYHDEIERGLVDGGRPKLPPQLPPDWLAGAKISGDDGTE